MLFLDLSQGPDQHAAVRAALAFQMVFFRFLSLYLKTAVRDAFIFIPALPVQEMPVRGENDLLVS